jgi:hypothetical protein
MSHEKRVDWLSWSQQIRRCAEKEFGGSVAIRNVEDGTNPPENQYSAPVMVRDTSLFG